MVVVVAGEAAAYATAVRKSIPGRRIASQATISNGFLS